ncbi:MAG: AraC family transcriptional regulator [Rhodospirillales bacterium]|jgi:AraC-like DNA-binding protein|nr:AraC family transcriptional regulator [Rhodospirillales bacterium]
MRISVSPTDYLVSHCQLVTSDLDFARDSVGRLWEYHRSHLQRGRHYGIRWHQTSFGRSTLSFARSPSSIRVVCGPIGPTFRVTLMEGGRLRHRICGEEGVSTPGRAVVHGPGQMLELETEPFSMLMLSLDGAAMHDALQQRYGPRPPLHLWLREFPLDTAAGVALRALCRWAARELDRPDAEIVTSPLAAASLERALIMLVLACADDHHPRRDDRVADVARDRIGQVEDWLAANLKEPIGVEEMAAAAGVSVRSLQVGFRRYRGCSPTQRLMELRMQAAHQALAAPTPEHQVTAVATEFGFFNFGRFASRYRQRFGESPSQTLSRSRHR